ncbi:MAG TPA: hypothetical protein DCL48_10225 [Alphaproteobacteria bacterium]|nr:hypothetical protein [Alphaproteobacteria bacterium]
MTPMARWQGAIVLVLSIAGAASAHATGQYERAGIRTSAMPLERQAQVLVKELVQAVERRDRVAIHGMLAPGFEVAGPGAPRNQARLTARQRFDAVWPGWEALRETLAPASWGPRPDKPTQLCAPAPLTANDLERIARAARERGDRARSAPRDWAYTDKTRVSVHAKASPQSEVLARLTREAVRVVGQTKGWLQVALPNSEVGFVRSEHALRPNSRRLCLAKVKGLWRIGAYLVAAD